MGPKLLWISVIMNGNFLSNKGVSNRVSQAGEKLGIVSISSIHHLCCALLPGSTEPLRESGVIELRLPFSALGIPQCKLLNVLGQCRSVQSEEVTDSVFYTINYLTASAFPKSSSLMFCRKSAYKYFYLRTVFHLLKVHVFHSLFLINQLYCIPQCIPLLCTWWHLFVLVWRHLIYSHLYLGDYFIRKIRIFVIDTDFYNNSLEKEGHSEEIQEKHCHYLEHLQCLCKLCHLIGWDWALGKHLGFCRGVKVRENPN